MNKDESEKCLNLAFSFYNKGNYEKVGTRAKFINIFSRRNNCSKNPIACFIPKRLMILLVYVMKKLRKIKKNSQKLKSNRENKKRKVNQPNLIILRIKFKFQYILIYSLGEYSK